MSFLDSLLSFWNKATAEPPQEPRPKVFEQVEVAFWKSNTYRAENGDLEDITPSSIRVVSYWNLSRGNKIELNLTFPLDFPSESHSIRVAALVTGCRKPKGRRRYRIDCQLKDLDVSVAQKIQEFIDWAVKQP